MTQMQLTRPVKSLGPEMMDPGEMMLASLWQVRFGEVVAGTPCDERMKLYTKLKIYLCPEAQNAAQRERI